MDGDLCYIDKWLCTGGRFSFCPECLEAKEVNAEEIKNARTPLELSLAHILSVEQLASWYAKLQTR